MTLGPQRICLITPGHLSGNPRIVKEADALSAAGHSVTVISSRFSQTADAADRAFAGRPWTSRRDAAFGPLASRPAYLWQSLSRHVARKALVAYPDNVQFAERACHPAAPALTAAAVAVKADLYIAHYTAALPAAAHAAKRHGALFGFDAEDFHPGDLPDAPEHAFEKHIIDRIERHYLPRAAHLTAASPGIAEAYAQRYGIRMPDVVLNVFGLTPGAPCMAREDVRSPSLYWFSQTIGPGRGLESAAGAIGLARSAPHLYIRGTGSKDYIRNIQSIAARHGAGSRLHVLPACLPSELEERGMAYDVGLALEIPLTHNRELALSNKLFSYLSSGLAVVLSDTTAQKRIAPELEGAVRLVAAGDPVALAAAVDELVLDRSRLSAMRATAKRLARDRFNWEIEGRVLVDAVNAALARHKRA